MNEVVVKNEVPVLPAIKDSYTPEEMQIIHQKFGVCVWFPEQLQYFKEDLTAITALKQTPNYYELLKINHLSEINEKGAGLSIVKIKKFCGLKYVQAILAIAITDLCNFFNINKNMSVEQIGQTVNFIIETYPLNCLTIADIKLCFNKIKQGHYGKIYDRLDGGVILDALNVYMEKRTDYFDNQSYNEHMQRKANNIERPDNTKQMAAAHQEIIRIMKKNNKL